MDVKNMQEKNLVRKTFYLSPDVAMSLENALIHRRAGRRKGDPVWTESRIAEEAIEKGLSCTE